MTWIVSPAYAEEAAHGVTADAAQTEAHAGAAAGAHESSFPPFDASNFPSQLLWLAIVFIALYRVMDKRIIPQISGILTARSERIRNDIEEAEAARAKTDKAIADYEAGLAAAKARAGAIAAGTRAEVAKAIERRRQAAEASLTEKLQLAERHIDDVKRAAVSQVTDIALDTTEAVVGELLGPVASRTEIAAAVAAAEKR